MLDPSQELDAIIAQYLQAKENGEEISAEQIMTKYPEHANRLAEFFSDLDGIKKVADGPTESIDILDNHSSKLGKQSRLVAGRYKLLQKIGAGGMGEVWMADQIEPVRRRVALKLIKAGSNNDKVIARFEAERQALALMDHPNIARVLDGGTTEDGQPYFVMELVQGLPVTQYCDKNRLGLSARLQVFTSVCEAVHHAHQKGIIHRDLKPSNILVAVYNGKPVPKVIDFGLAKAWGNQPQLTDKTLFTEFGAVVGTLQYMSPEQAELDAVDIDTRADIYALGVLLYELLTGTTPIERETLEQQAVLRVLQEIRETDPPKPSVRLSSTGTRLSEISSQRQIDSAKLQSELKGDLDWIVMKALEKDRARRYESASSFSSDIQRYLAGDAIEARPPSWRYRFGKALKRNRLAVSIASGFLLLLLFGSAVSTLLAIRARNSEALAKQNERIATEESRKARDAEQAAKKARELEASQRKKSEKLLYRSNVQLALARIEEGSLDLARKLLKDTPEELRNIEYWHAESMLDQSKMVLRGHDGSVNCVCFSPDGKLLATGGRDQTIRLWDASSGKEIKKIEGMQGDVEQVCFTADGNRLLGIHGNSLSTWSIDTAALNGHLLKISNASPPPIICNRDGRSFGIAQTLVDSAHESIGHQALAIDALTLQIKNRFQHPDFVDCLAFSSDGRVLFTSSGGNIRRWEVYSGKMEVSNVDESESNVNYDYLKALDSGDRLVCGANYEGVICFIDSHTLKTIDRWNLDKGGVRFLCVSDDERRLFYATTDGAVHGFDLYTGKADIVFRGHTGKIVAGDCQLGILATSGEDGTVRLWDLSRKHLAVNSHTHDVRFAAEDSIIIVNASNHKFTRPEVLELNGDSILKTPFPHGGILSTTGSHLLAQTENAIDIVDLRTGKVEKTIQCDSNAIGWIRCYSSEQSSLATVEGNRIALISSDSGSIRHTLEIPEEPDLSDHALSVLSMCFAENGTKLIALNGNGQVFVWDLTTVSRIATHKVPGFNANSDVAAVSPAGCIVAFGSGNKIHLLDYVSGSLKTIEGHKDSISSVEFNLDGSRIVTLDENGTLRIWDSNDLEEVATFKNLQSYGQARFSVSGRQIVTTDASGYPEFFGAIDVLKPSTPSSLPIALGQSLRDYDPRVNTVHDGTQFQILLEESSSSLRPFEIRKTSNEFMKEGQAQSKSAGSLDTVVGLANKESTAKELEDRLLYYDKALQQTISLIDNNRIKEAIEFLDKTIQELGSDTIKLQGSSRSIALYGERAILHARLGNLQQMEEDLQFGGVRQIDMNDRPELFVYYRVIATANGPGLNEAIAMLSSEKYVNLLGNLSLTEMRLWNCLADFAIARGDSRSGELRARALAILEAMSGGYGIVESGILDEPDLESLRSQPEYTYWVWGRSDGAFVDIKDRISFRRKINAILTLVETKEFGKLIDFESQDFNIEAFLRTEFEFRPATDITDYRRALAVVGLLKLGSNPWEDFWKSNPSERTLFYLLEMLRRFEVPAPEILKFYSSAQTGEQSTWALLTLANYPAESFEVSMRDSIVAQAREYIADTSQYTAIKASSHRLLAHWFPGENKSLRPSLAQLPITPSDPDSAKNLRPIEISTTEVTALQYAQFRDQDTPIPKLQNLPVRNVTMSEAGEFCNWLSQQEGLSEDQWCYEAKGEPPFFALKANALKLQGYRLPTLAEFEAAADYSALDDSSSPSLVEAITWTKGNSSFEPQSVALKMPNHLGLFDMLGNVEEWVHPEHGDSSSESNSQSAYLAGGAVWLPTKHFAETYSRPQSPEFKSPYVGFRVVRAK